MTENKSAQPLHAESIKFLKICEDLKFKHYDDLSLEEARECCRKIVLMAAGDVNVDGTRVEYFIPSTDVPDGIPVYVYVPTKRCANPPMLVYYHGGGTIVGDRVSVDSTCKLLSSGAGCIVVNVEYRLTPEHKFPAGLHDSCQAARWVLENKEKIGGGPASKVGVSGDSAGGQLSASVAHDVPGIDFQILVYPHLSARGDRSLRSYQEYKHIPGLDHKDLDWYENLMADVSEWRNPRIANLLRDKFDHLPPCLLIVAECDPLRDDSYEYAKKLTAAGVHNELYLAKGALHQYYTLPATYKELCQASYSRAFEFIKKWGTA